MSNQAQSNESEYFDLHTTGIGYFNRIREVKPNGRNAKPVLSVTIAALCGSKEAVE